MNNKQVQLLKEFKAQLINFLDELIEQFPTEGDLVISRIFINDQMPIIDIMNIFVENIHPKKDLIKEKNENFFLEETTLFSIFSENKVNNFKNLWKTLDSSDKDIVWEWVNLFVVMSDKYIQYEKENE